MIVGSRRAT